MMKAIKDADKIDALEQYGRRQNLEIVGIPEKANEDTNKIVIEVAKLLKVDIAVEHIFTSHRLPAKRKLNDDKDLVPRPVAYARWGGGSGVKPPL